MSSRSTLTELATTFGPRARRAAVTLSALIDARRRIPTLPDPLRVRSEADLADATAALARISGGAAARGAGVGDATVARLARELAVVVDWNGLEDPAGRVLQEFRAAEDRKRHGAFYTPGWVVDSLLDAVGALEGARVLDPACGSGAFLLAAARRGARVSGADVDAEALEVARVRLAVEGRATEALEAGDLLADRGRLAGPFDAVVGNPPYVRFHEMDEAQRARLGAMFETARGQFDLFAPFLEASLARLARVGRLGFVLPALVLRGARYRELRRFLLRAGSVVAVIDHGDGAFGDVQAPTCAIVLRKGGARGRVRYQPPSGAAIDVDESIWREDPEAAFAPVAAAGQRLLAELATGVPLGELARFGRGLEIGKRHPAFRDRSGKGCVPCLTGDDVARHRFAARRWIDVAKLPAKLRPSGDDLAARVLVRETGERLTAARVPEGIATTRSLFHLVPHDAALAPVLVAWINSSVAQWWFATCIRADSGIFPKLRIVQLKSLRVPRDPALRATLGELARERARSKSDAVAEGIDRRIDDEIAEALGLDAEARAAIGIEG